MNQVMRMEDNLLLEFDIFEGNIPKGPPITTDSLPLPSYPAGCFVTFKA
jgi:hypothetical protein